MKAGLFILMVLKQKYEQGIHFPVIITDRRERTPLQFQNLPTETGTLYTGELSRYRKKCDPCFCLKFRRDF